MNCLSCWCCRAAAWLSLEDVCPCAHSMNCHDSVMGSEPSTPSPSADVSKNPSLKSVACAFGAHSVRYPSPSPTLNGARDAAGVSARIPCVPHPYSPSLSGLSQSYPVYGEDGAGPSMRAPPRPCCCCAGDSVECPCCCCCCCCICICCCCADSSSASGMLVESFTGAAMKYSASVCACVPLLMSRATSRRGCSVGHSVSIPKSS